MIEPEAPVVDPVQSHLVAAVLDPDSVAHVAGAVADRHDQYVDAVAFAGDDQLG
jgi:hypothetical protein